MRIRSGLPSSQLACSWSINLSLTQTLMFWILAFQSVEHMDFAPITIVLDKYFLYIHCMNEWMKQSSNDFQSTIFHPSTVSILLQTIVQRVTNYLRGSLVPIDQSHLPDITSHNSWRISWVMTITGYLGK